MSKLDRGNIIEGWCLEFEGKWWGTLRNSKGEITNQNGWTNSFQDVIIVSQEQIPNINLWESHVMGEFAGGLVNGNWKKVKVESNIEIISE